MHLRPFRLALVSDMLEERWFSMDLVTDMLFDQLSTSYQGICSVCQIRPALKRFSSATRFTANSSGAWMFDRLLNRHVSYPRLLRPKIREFDLFHVIDHSYANLVNQLPAERTVVTCHDLDAFQTILEPRPGTRANILRFVMGQALKGMQKAAHTIFDTHVVRNTAVHQGLVTAARSSVVPIGVHPSCSTVPKREAEQKAAELLNANGRRPVLLHVGSTIPRKRIDVLLQVTAQVACTFPEVILVRVGGGLTNEQKQLAEDLKVARRIVELPYLDRDVLAAVYRCADVVLQPSEAEGFGLPVVEAMACGCAVVASDLEVLREVGGSAASYCPVGDVERWAGTVVEVLEEALRRPHERQQRQQLAAAHAAGFSWAETTKRVVEIYEQVMKRG